MKRFPLFLTLIAGLMFAVGCETNDVDPDSSGTIDPDRYFELTDAAFGEFLEYNSLYQATAANKLPEGIVFTNEAGTLWYLNKDVAATVTGRIYLTQNAANIASLQEKGYSGAKITNVEGMEFFVNATEIYMTDCDVSGALDLTMLTHLKALQARRNYINGLSLPASIEDLRCEPKSGATDDQKLTSLDLSACVGINNILLDGAKIAKSALLTPENPTAVSIVASLLNASAVPYPCTQAFYDKLADQTSKSFFTVPLPPDPYELTDANFALYLKYNMDELETLPEGLIFEGTGANAGKYYLDKNLAPSVTTLDIHQNGSWDTDIIAAGYTIGKITNIDGIQFFTALTSIDMTSATVAGSLNLSALTALTEVKMNNNYCSAVTLPASIVTLNFNASSNAAAGKLTAIDFSACANLATTTLTNHNIAQDAFTAPTAPTKSNIVATLTGNPFAAAGYTTTITFYNSLNTASKAFFTDPNPVVPTTQPFNIKWDTSAQTTTGGASPWNYTSSLSTPTALSTIGITADPVLVKGVGFTASQTKVFGGTMGTKANSSTAEVSRTNNMYFTLTITSTSTALTFTQITSNFRRSGNGGTKCDVEYSLDGGTTFTLIRTLDTTSDFLLDTSAGNDVTINLSAVTALAGITNKTVIFRFTPYEAAGGSGGFYIANGDTPFVLSGTTPIP